MASLQSLLKSSDPEPEEVIKACNAALRESKTDGVAQHAKVVALLNLDRYEDAVRVFGEFGKALQDRAPIEHAYALYKSGQLEKARDIVLAVDEKPAKHLAAQVSYRLEDFASAFKIYKQLWERRDSTEESDLRTNLGATDAQLEWARQGELVTKKRPGREDLETFETAYNAACGSIARGELGQSEVLLQRAKGLCESTDRLSSEEKNDELLPIAVQQLYVFASLGKTEQAESLLKELAISEIPDLSTRMIAHLNQLNTATQDTNPYLIQRLVTSESKLPTNDQLFDFQKSTIDQNLVALDLLASKFQGVGNLTKKLIDGSTAPTTSASINVAGSANAAARAQNQLGKVGLKTIVPLLEKRPKDIGLLATIIQLYILTNNYGAAATVLDAFLKRLESKNDAELAVRYAPGLVALAVSVYSKQGRTTQVQNELAKAASYWRHKSKYPPELLRVAGFSLLGSGEEEDLEEAGKIFETIYQQDDSDKFARAGLVAAFAQSDLAKIKTEAEKLPTVDRLIAGIDVDALENAGVPHSSTTASEILSRKRAGAGTQTSAKKRKSKLPKNYDANKKPDPERWLPLRDRSTYKPKGKKGKQKQAALTQGGVEKEQATEAPKPAQNSGGGGGGGGGAGGKPKKKKGKK